MMKHLALTAAVGAGLMGCAAEPVQLQQDRSHHLEWNRERAPLGLTHPTRGPPRGEGRKPWGGPRNAHWPGSPGGG